MTWQEQLLHEAVMAVTPKLAGATLAATLAYLALAVLGWGGFIAFFSHPARAVLALAVLIMAGVGLFAGGSLRPGVREDRRNRWVLVVFGLIGLLSAYLPAYTDRKEIWAIDGDTIRWLGVLLFGRRAADLAGPRARPPLHRTGRHPARPPPGHDRPLRRHPPPQLSGFADQQPGLGRSPSDRASACC